MTRASCLRTAQGERIALVGGLRSPFARQASAYLGVPAVELGRQVVDELIWRTGVDPAVVDLLVFGQVIQMPAAPILLAKSCWDPNWMWPPMLTASAALAPPVSGCG